MLNPMEQEALKLVELIPSYVIVSERANSNKEGNDSKSLP